MAMKDTALEDGARIGNRGGVGDERSKGFAEGGGMLIKSHKGEGVGNGEGPRVCALDGVR